jgi:UDP:flavonoid glycosyltransferase YjiC (YdhE family)
MRVLFTVQPSIGHLHPLVPVASALAGAGHEVAVASSPSFGDDIRAFGLDPIGVGLDWLTADQSTWGPFGELPPPGPEFGKFVTRMFVDITTEATVPDLVRTVGDWKPDLIVRESMEYGGCIAAELLRIPHASIAGNAYSAVDSPDLHYFPGNRRIVAGVLARHLEKAGLPPDPDADLPFRSLHLAFAPPEWEGSSTSRPPNTVFVRHVSAVRPGLQPPEWMGKLPDQPTVYASLGTVFNNTPGVLEAIVEALQSEPVNLIVAIGRDRDPGGFGPRPANVRIERYVPQPLVLEQCQAFITHGGFNSVKESLIHGVPMAVIPITADQPYSAERCAALGVATVVGADDRSSAAIQSAVHQVLGDAGYAAAAHEFQDRMLSLPGPDQMVELLERVAREGSSKSRPELTANRAH